MVDYWRPVTGGSGVVLRPLADRERAKGLIERCYQEN